MAEMYEVIDRLLDLKGISGAKMSEDLGMSKSFMTELRKGRAKSVKIETAQKIADYFEVTTDCLIGREPLQNEENPTAQTGSEALKDVGYYQLNEENKKLIDQMIVQLIKSQSGD